MATSHATMTGAELHEPKGADSAPVDTVYVADGSGSGDWKKIGEDNLDIDSLPFVTEEVFAQYILRGEGTPEGAVTAEVGTLYLRTDGSTDTTLYVKETGSGTTGWVAK